MKKIFISLLAAFFLALKQNAHAGGTVVIANPPSRYDERVLDRESVYLIFTLRTKMWSDGSSVRIFLLPKDSILTRDFSVKYLEMSAFKYFDLIEARQALGRVNVPRVLKSEQEVIIKVLTTPGSIGYANETNANNSNDGFLVIVP